MHKFFNKRVDTITYKNLIVATALPGLNTRPAKSPWLPLLGGGSKAEVYSKALPQIKCYPLLQKSRGYVSENNTNNNYSNNINNNNGCLAKGETTPVSPSFSLQKSCSRKGSFIDYFWSSIVCLIFLLFIYYMFESYFTFIITFYISFLVSLYVSDNFKYSSLYIIRLNQKFAITIITIFLWIIVGSFSSYIMDYFDIINHIFCEGNDSVDVSVLRDETCSKSDTSNNSSNNSSNKSSNNYVQKEDIIVTSKEVLDKVGDVVTTIVKDAVGPFIENIATAAGAGSAGGAIGAKIISSMPAGSSITHKAFAGAGAAALTAAGVAGAIKSVNTAFNNKSTKDSITSNISSQRLERSPSPLEDFIHSVLEPSDITSPLETLLDYQIFFIALSLLCILCIIMIIGFWVFNKYNINIIKYILGTRLGNKLMASSAIVKLNFIKNMNNKLFISMIVIYTILLIFCLIFQIFIGVELRLKLEDYIEVHNYLKNSR
jgi:hypothetical protein